MFKSLLTFKTGATLLAAAACLGLAAPAVAGPVPGPEMLPAKTYAMFSIVDVETLKERMLESSFGDLLEDEKFAEFIDECKAKYDAEVADKVLDAVGLSLEEILAIATGEFTVAFAEVGDQRIGFAGLLDYEDADDLDVLIGKIEEAYEKRGMPRMTETVDGTEVILHELAGKSSEVVGELAYCKRDGRFVFGNERMIEAILDRWDGGSRDNLAGADVYSYIAEKTRSDDRDPTLAWYVDPVALVELGIRANQQTVPQAQMALGFFPILGLKNVRAFGGAADVATDEYESVSKSVLYVEMPPAGVLGLFKFPPTQQAVSDWVPSEVVGYSAFNWDVDGAYGAVRDLFNMFQGPGSLENQIDRLAELPTGPGIHIKDDVIDGLSGAIEVATFAPSGEIDDEGPFNPAAFQQEAVIAAELTDPARVKELLAEFAETDAYTGRVRTFEGTPIYEVPNPQAAQGGPENVATAVVGSKLFVSFGSDHVEDVIRGIEPEERLAESDLLAKVMENVPAQTSILGYQSGGAQLEAVYGMLRSDLLSQQLGGFDLFESLPPFEAIEEYLTVSGSYAVPDPKGVMFVGFAIPSAD